MTILDYIKSKKARIDIMEIMENRYQLNLQLEDFSIPEHLFKYSELNKFTLNNLKENNLTATSPTEFNDIYDSSMHFNSTYRVEEEIKSLNKYIQTFNYEEIINLDKLSRDIIQNTNELDEDKFASLTKDYRIVCLSTDYGNIKMWGQYGDNNQGICTCYNLSKSKNNLNAFTYPIIYLKEPINVTDMCEDLNNLDLATLVSVISKSIEWENEKEWRIVFGLLGCKEKRIELINIPKPECIYLGPKFIDKFRGLKERRDTREIIYQEFLELVKELNIKIKMARPQISKYKLDFVDIDVYEIIKSL